MPQLRPLVSRCSLMLWWCSLVLITGWVHPPALQAYNVVVIDAGHGGSEPGAHWHGLKEKNLTLDVARRVETILKRNGMTTAMTRRSDKTVSLDSRAALANRYRNSLLLSIHFNASRNRLATGYETFYRSARGRKIALMVNQSLGRKIRGPNRGVVNRRLAVLTRTRGVAILVECGFMSNRVEASRCASPAYRQQIAEGIANGVLRARRL